MTFLNITWQLDWFSEMFGIQQSRQVTEPRISFWTAFSTMAFSLF